MFRTIFTAFALLCPIANSTAEPPADLVVRNGKVLTVDAKFTTAEAVAIRDGVIVKVGTDAEIKPLIGDKTRVIDARGKSVIPGLIESHVHAINVGRGEVIGPEQKVSREDALRMMTIDAAYLSFDEKKKGSIEVGKLGDLAVLADDFLTCDEDRITHIKVVATVVGGKVVYEAKAK
ncbi:MAG: amidohydrolase family protein [Gemmataceae bacterium]